METFMEKSPNVWKLTYKLLNNIQVKEKNQKKLETILNKMKMQCIKVYGMQQKLCFEGNV